MFIINALSENINKYDLQINHEDIYIKIINIKHWKLDTYSILDCHCERMREKKLSLKSQNF